MTSQTPAPNGALALPARVIPVPKTISPQAQNFLATPSIEIGPVPPAHDKAAWRTYAAAADANFAPMNAAAESAYPAKIEAEQMESFTLYKITPESFDPKNAARAILYLHGGGYVLGGGRTAAIMALPLAAATQCVVYAPDYRMPPDHPFPAALDDAVSAYRHLVARTKSGNIALAGLSAGGGLAAATALKVRDLGLPRPGCAVLATPEVDLTESGDTFQTNQTLDVVLKGPLPEMVALYADGHDLRDPYLSPVFGDFTKGFVPTLLLSGTRDLFLSNTVILHRALRRAGIEADLHVFEAMPHAGFFGAPEDFEAMGEQVRFIDAHLGRE